jgi:hypothetical protein
VDGSAQLDGTLVADASGYSAQAGDSFTLLQAGNVAGTFAAVSAPALAGFTANYAPTQVSLAMAPPPAPGQPPAPAAPSPAPAPAAAPGAAPSAPPVVGAPSPASPSPGPAPAPVIASDGTQLPPPPPPLPGAARPPLQGDVDAPSPAPVAVAASEPAPATTPRSGAADEVVTMTQAYLQRTAWLAPMASSPQDPYRRIVYTPLQCKLD